MVTAAQEIMAETDGLWKAAQVSEKVRREASVEVRAAYVSQVLRSRLGLRYKRVRPIKEQANRELQTVQRQLCGKLILDLLAQGKRIVNIDETWVDRM